jgi:hypothetical protein
MGHEGDSDTLVTFAISGACPALSADFTYINRYVAQSLIDSHYNCLDNLLVCRQFQESAPVLISGVEYRATLNLRIEREVDVEFPKLIGLLVGTVRELSDATGGTAFEMVSLNGKIEEVRFEAWWTWYEYSNGAAKGCGRS